MNDSIKHTKSNIFNKSQKESNYNNLTLSKYEANGEDKMIEKSLLVSYLSFANNKKQPKKRSIFPVSQKPSLMSVSNFGPRNKHSNLSFIQSQIKEQEIQEQNILTLDVLDKKDSEGFCACWIKNYHIKYDCRLSNTSIANELTLVNKVTKNIQYTINFNCIKAQIQSKNDSQGKLTSIIFKASNQLILQFQSFGNKKLLKQAYTKLKYRIDNSLGIRYQLVKLYKQPQFWKRRYRLQRQFVQQCQTGDIILFQGSHMMAKAQRLLTNSDFDHVGIIIRDPIYDILLYESNGQTGVCLTPWKLIAQYEWYDAIPRIVWRKLEGIKRDYDFTNKFHDFVVANMHRKYYISFDKLLSNQSVIPGSQDDKGYFCSELVARVYKVLQLLPEKGQKDYQSAQKYYPYHFTQKAQLKLTGNARLSEQYNLVWEEQVLNEDYNRK